MADSYQMIVSEMEASFLNIFMEAAAKMADLTKSKLFVVFESSDGSRQIGGNRELVTTFQSGYLLPQPSDVVLGDSTEQFQPGSNLEADFGSISGFTEVVSDSPWSFLWAIDCNIYSDSLYNVLNICKFIQDPNFALTEWTWWKQIWNKKTLREGL